MPRDPAPPGPPPPGANGLPPCSNGADVPGGVSRRGFLGATGAGAAGLAAAGSLAASRNADAADDEQPEPGREKAAVSVTLNGARRELNFDARATLLDTLRERLGLTGIKKGCDHGSCGACTVHVKRPGEDSATRQLACLTFALTLGDAEVTTIEGLPATAGKGGDDLHPVQDAFLRCDGYQCGYCTPGQIMSATALIAEGHAGSREEVREWMSGNLCRCGAYPNIVAAVRQAAGAEPPADTADLAVIVPAADPNEGEG